MSAFRAQCSAAVLLAVACSDPAFVSLGRNAQRVANAPDAGGADATGAGQPESPTLPLGCPLSGTSEPVDTACEQRLLLSCPEDASRMLFDVIARCTELAYQLTVRFDAGCATAFRLDASQALGILASPGVHDCVAARLTAERYECAQTVDCAVGSTFPLITR